jgi:hypothetical protein
MTKRPATSKKSVLKKLGRPPTHSTPVTVRFSPELMAALDAARADMKIEPSHPEIVRFAVATWLRTEGYLK